MVKIILTFICFSSFLTFSQISGDIVNDNRKLITDYSYVLEGHLDGKIAFDISVNAKGEISATKIMEDRSTITSTPAKIEARNYVMKFKFQPGTWFPKFHHGIVVLTMVKSK
jgi:hypothetical protein